MSVLENEALVQEAIRIVQYFKKNGVIIRTIGAVAFRIHCKESLDLFRALKREVTDVDLVSYSKHVDDTIRLMEQLNCLADKRMRMIRNILKRYVFQNQIKGCHIDVFFDKLDMCHTIDFRNRLEVDYPTAPLAELLLEKMQIVQLTEKDIKDTIVLLLEHDIGDHDDETINGDYISKILARDWGFYYTVTKNLNEVKEYVSNFKILNSNHMARVNSRINSLLNLIEKQPKSMSWKIRARLGTRKKWYNEVESLP